MVNVMSLLAKAGSGVEFIFLLLFCTANSILLGGHGTRLVHIIKQLSDITVIIVSVHICACAN